MNPVPALNFLLLHRFVITDIAVDVHDRNREFRDFDASLTPVVKLRKTKRKQGIITLTHNTSCFANVKV